MCVCSMNMTLKVMQGFPLSPYIQQSFSDCSRGHFEKFLNTRNSDCLLDKPRFEALVTPPVCGNGFLENDEQCDCGSLEVN